LADSDQLDVCCTSF